MCIATSAARKFFSPTDTEAPAAAGALATVVRATFCLPLSRGLELRSTGTSSSSSSTAESRSGGLSSLSDAPDATFRLLRLRLLFLLALPRFVVALA